MDKLDVLLYLMGERRWELSRQAPDASGAGAAAASQAAVPGIAASGSAAVPGNAPAAVMPVPGAPAATSVARATPAVPGAAAPGAGGRLLHVAGPRPGWLPDLLLLLPFCQEAAPGTVPGAGDVVLVTDPALGGVPGTSLDGTAGKKTLWRSLLASGLLGRG